MTIPEPLKILMVVEQCNPEWASVPLLASHFYRSIRQYVDVTLVTHERNRSALENIRKNHTIHYIEEPSWIKRYFKMIKVLTDRGATNWPLQHALSYPIYGSFDNRVSRRFGPAVRAGEYDLVHVLTPILPRYPSRMITHCRNTPFLLGPVNGGVPFPEGFDTVAKKEFAGFNFLRRFTRLIPGYSRTYRKADRVLSGSAYTRQMLMELFGLDSDKIRLFHENGISPAFIKTPKIHTGNTLKLLFVGRLVAYKGADMAIQALAALPEGVRERVSLTIVGDGPERNTLEKLAAGSPVRKQIRFTGWIPQEETATWYEQSDLFCFPSVREFGGAVALEAMGCGLPCIVPDYAGLGEYVTPETGFKIPPTRREDMIRAFSEKIAFLLDHPELRTRMSAAAIKRVRSYAWENKARDMVAIYRELARGYRPEKTPSAFR